MPLSKRRLLSLLSLAECLSGFGTMEKGVEKQTQCQRNYLTGPPPCDFSFPFLLFANRLFFSFCLDLPEHHFLVPLIFIIQLRVGWKLQNVDNYVLVPGVAQKKVEMWKFLFFFPFSFCRKLSKLSMCIPRGNISQKI